MRALLRLAGGLRYLLPNLLVSRHIDVAVLVPEEESILEELLDMNLSGLDRLHFLLHALVLSHPGSDFGFSLLLLELLLLDLGL